MASTLSQVHNRPTILSPPSSFSQDICRAILASSQTPKYAHAFSNSQVIETPPPPPPSPVGFRNPSFLCEKNRTWRGWRVVHEVSVIVWTKIYKTKKKNTDYWLRLITSTSYLYLCLFTSPCLCIFPRHDVRLYVFRYFDNCMLIYFIGLGYADS